MPFQQQPGSTAPNQMIVAVMEAIRSGDNEGAAVLANKALALGQRHPVLYNARALALQQTGQFREALAEFNQALALAPTDTHIANAIGVCLLNLNQPVEAIKSFEQAIAIDPFQCPALFPQRLDAGNARRSGRSKKTLRSSRCARPESCRRARKPRVPRSRRRKIRGRESARRARAKNRTVAANRHRRTWRHRSGESRFYDRRGPLSLRARYGPAHIAHAGDHHRIGGRCALDGQGRYAEAFACYRYENNEKRKLYAQSYTGQTRLPESSPTGSPRSWTRLPQRVVERRRRSTGRPESAASRTHAFLVGFSRSGTTLLEQVLASHPEIVALEEQDLLAAAAHDLLASEAGMRRLRRRSPIWTNARP
jgi:tetratricopeptide (TPR) repeat protein